MIDDTTAISERSAAQLLGVSQSAVFWLIDAYGVPEVGHSRCALCALVRANVEFLKQGFEWEESDCIPPPGAVRGALNRSTVITTAEASLLLGITPQRIGQLVDMGLIDKYAHGKFKLCELITGYCSYLRSGNWCAGREMSNKSNGGRW
jgi:hypothetical protein